MAFNITALFFGTVGGGRLEFETLGIAGRL